MNTTADRLKELQKQLTSGCEVCCSHGMLDTFPDALRISFLVEHIGIIICHRGHFSFVTGKETHKAVSGKTVFINREVYFHITESSSDCLYSLLFYRVDSIRDLLGNTVRGMKFWEVINPASCQIFDTAATSGLSLYIDMLSSLKNDNADVFIEKERLLLMLSLTYHLCSLFSRLLGVHQSAPARQTDIYISFIQLVGQYFNKHRGVSFYADKLCLSPKYLSSIVKSVSGMTVQQHVFKAIVRQSIFLINNTDKSVKQISDLLNFPNPSAFGTFFKKHTGLSPRHFRKENIGKTKQ